MILSLTGRLVDLSSFVTRKVGVDLSFCDGGEIGALSFCTTEVSLSSLVTSKVEVLSLSGNGVSFSPSVTKDVDECSFLEMSVAKPSLVADGVVRDWSFRGRLADLSPIVKEEVKTLSLSSIDVARSLVAVGTVTDRSFSNEIPSSEDRSWPKDGYTVAAEGFLSLPSNQEQIISKCIVLHASLNTIFDNDCFAQIDRLRVLQFGILTLVR